MGGLTAVEHVEIVPGCILRHALNRRRVGETISLPCFGLTKTELLTFVRHRASSVYKKMIIIIKKNIDLASYVLIYPSAVFCQMKKRKKRLRVFSFSGALV